MTTTSQDPTTTSNQDQPCDCCQVSDKCEIAKTALCPDCFKLRIGYDPSTSSYDLSLCSPTVVFTDACCVSGSNSIILRIPLIFAQDCNLYRLNTASTAIDVSVYNEATGIEKITLIRPAIDGGYLNFTIPARGVALTQNGTCDCVATITFASFFIPVQKLPSFCYCPSLCNSVSWVQGKIDLAASD
jgi:hypothetical protein